ncbi:cytochrome C oxidase subunit IV family protein [Xanthomarina sp.]|uniref:cytochrome C oxidase subunit IV family protein n=1 Tax=Xanthomarina sp. TaxID=1931211 RepID=UPI002C474443|nr:cytochrome C oxidase subunit IV family protein [Xanthomarina sp.]HLV38245.1 cytochrome C oxidase subunit IV family protein [Xanthomarina sp.]
MKKKAFLTVLIILVILTVLSAFVSNSGIANSTQYIMLLSALKFLAVAFYFMELRHANAFWKVLLIGCLTIFISLVLII